MTRISMAAIGCAAMLLAGGAQAATTKAEIDFNTCAKPVYPPAAIKAQHDGTVTVKFLVAPDGAVRESKVQTSSGHPDLDEATRDALKLCKFRPATKNGKAVQQWTDAQYVWSLK